MSPITNPAKNKLYYGDNLQVLRDYIPDASVDLIYRYPRLQLLTIKDLLEGNKNVQRPLHVRDITFKKAPTPAPTPPPNSPSTSPPLKKTSHKTRVPHLRAASSR